MTTNPDQAPDMLERLWEDIDPSAAPVADLLAAGHAATRRRRRGLSTVGAVVAVLLVSGGVLALDERGGSGSESRVTGAPDLAVELTSGTSQAETGLFGGPVNSAAAIWNPDERTLVYLSGFEWSSSCPPEGSAELTGAGVLVLELDDVGSGTCTADAGRVTATVSGLTGAPAELIVKTGGSATAVPIADESFDAAAFTLDCGSDTRVVTTIPDYFGTPRGLPTPIEAVQGMLAEDETSVVGLESPDAESVSVALLRADGSTRAVVTLNRVSGGGWVVGVSNSCPGELLARRPR